MIEGILQILAFWLCSLMLFTFVFCFSLSVSLFQSFIHPWYSSHLSLYFLCKGYHFIPWSQLLIKVHKFKFLYQLAIVFSSIYQHHMGLPKLVNPSKSQIECIIFPAKVYSSFFHHPLTY